jgi:membrane protein YqaA with SNARE-associated domain
MSYLALFAWSFVAATFVPLGSEPMVVVMVRQGHSLAAIVAVASAGNFLGACTTYALARGVAEALADKIATGTARRAGTLVASYGAPALLLSWVPIVGDAIVAAAGVAQMPFGRFAVWTAVGKVLRYTLVVWAAASWPA